MFTRYTIFTRINSTLRANFGHFEVCELLLARDVYRLPLDFTGSSFLLLRRGVFGGHSGDSTSLQHAAGEKSGLRNSQPFHELKSTNLEFQSLKFLSPPPKKKNDTVVFFFGFLIFFFLKKDRLDIFCSPVSAHRTCVNLTLKG